MLHWVLDINCSLYIKNIFDFYSVCFLIQINLHLYHSSTGLVHRRPQAWASYCLQISLCSTGCQVSLLVSLGFNDYKYMLLTKQSSQQDVCRSCSPCGADYLECFLLFWQSLPHHWPSGPHPAILIDFPLPADFTLLSEELNWHSTS